MRKLLASLALSMLSILGYGMQVTVVKLEPEVAQPIINVFMWPLTGICEVVSDYPENPIEIDLLSGSGKIDDVEYQAGSHYSHTAIPGEKFKVMSFPRAQLQIISHAQGTISIECVA